MTDNNHPITPPPELIQKWWDGTHGAFYEFETVTTHAARWGADKELEACCEWFQEFYKMETWVDRDLKTFRAARRPRPQSLAEEALEEVGVFEGMGTCNIDIIRRALERLQELEEQADD